ncbi:MAG: hypothetical protein RMZ41_016390 [Nostoc sp. DedVER02]|uniref:hypothetical protein n=1 Tax=unclassified Nostoc TaxID=2593658 RepID=UPI002AD562F6|nr:MULTISPECIES: hypothetical protein [unclassified Nostoc]MDZ7988431.1 hypothetical protein [Nostoc sp. DedVER02]MDZ8112169.1 hypothetical protein [Nostoc sp. DedVER01b]
MNTTGNLDSTYFNGDISTGVFVNISGVGAARRRHRLMKFAVFCLCYSAYGKGNFIQPRIAS